MTEFLVCMGIAFSFLIIMLFIIMIIAWCIDLIANIRYNYKIKHRFDKPPIAECYCKDCSMHGEDKECYKFDGWRTADEWFCWDAEPKRKDDIEC